MQKNLKEILDNKNKLLIGLLVLIFILAFFIDGEKSNKVVPTKYKPIAADTYIPSGYVLVPIELQNANSIDGIIGQFGVVDLFSVPNMPGEKTKKLAEKVKLIRAPLNPNQFAVLVPESKSDLVLSHSGLFNAVIQNSQLKEKEKFDESKKARKIVSIELNQESL